MPINAKHGIPLSRYTVFLKTVLWSDRPFYLFLSIEAVGTVIRAMK